MLCLIFSSCVTAPSEEQKTAALEIYMNCLRTAANRLDDDRSDAATVAIAIRGACEGASMRAKQTYCQGMTLDACDRFQRNVSGPMFETATTIVMQERQKRQH
jgi:hypothetical protein